MTFEQSLLSLQGLSLGDAFGASLFFPQALILIETRKLPEAPWCWTDDTQIALAVVDELRERAGIDQDSLARRLVRGYSTDPSRGYGHFLRQTLERISSGEYFRSAARAAPAGGSYSCSAAARAAPVGAFFSDNVERACHEAVLAAGVTHTDSDSFAGAEAVAAAASLAASRQRWAGEEFLLEILQYVRPGKVHQGIETAARIPEKEHSRAVRELGVGLNNSAQDTVPYALWCAAHHLQNLEEALWLAVAGMGMRDTICAITGGVVGLSARHIPAEWLKRREPLPGELRSRPRAASGRSISQHRPLSQAVKKDPPMPAQNGVRSDALTGLPNLLGLLDWTDKNAEKGEPLPFSLLALQITSLKDVNRYYGRTAGDELLKWYARILRAELGGQVFRIGGDQFTILLEEINATQAADQARRLSERLSRENFELPLKPVHIALIHFQPPVKISPGKVLGCIFQALSGDYFTLEDGMLLEFDAGALLSSQSFPWMMVDLAEQMIRLGHTADETLKLALTDSVSQLPNMRAAMSALEAAVAHSWKTAEPLAVLLIDGDNLRLYNQISYEAGDEAILMIGATIRMQLRQTDFLARWRTGDEFLVLLPDTPMEHALVISQRLCQAVERASQTWLLPSTISIGVATCPRHGQTVQELLHMAEHGLEAAKQLGKNQVALCEQAIPA